MKVRILVRPKSGILDPQGEAVRRALPALGFEGVKTVHVGRLVEMEVESADEVERMCRRLLANPTIEEYEWEVLS
jgi:phosphoribosylformylglycinamidine synthase